MIQRKPVVSIWAMIFCSRIRGSRIACFVVVCSIGFGLTGDGWTTQASAQQVDSSLVQDSPRSNAMNPNAAHHLHEDLVYATVQGQPQRLDLYLPKAVQRAPLVLWIHGGGWRGGSKARAPIRRLTKHGYAVASMEYRFTDRAIFPAQIHDCKAAVRWLRANEDEFGYDASWIAAAGSSAGGHLALLLGVSASVESLEGELGEHENQSSSVQAIIDYFGPSDFVLREKTQPERANTTKSGSFALLGGLKTGKVIPELQTLASPALHVTADDPPLLIFHGTDDQVVLMDQSERMRDVYLRHALDVRLVTEQGAGHGAPEFFVGEHFETLLSFLAKHRPPTRTD